VIAGGKENFGLLGEGSDIVLAIGRKNEIHGDASYSKNTAGGMIGGEVGIEISNDFQLWPDVEIPSFSTPDVSYEGITIPSIASPTLSLPKLEIPMITGLDKLELLGEEIVSDGSEEETEAESDDEEYTLSDLGDSAVDMAFMGLEAYTGIDFRDPDLLEQFNFDMLTDLVDVANYLDVEMISSYAENSASGDASIFASSAATALPSIETLGNIGMSLFSVGDFVLPNMKTVSIEVPAFDLPEISLSDIPLGALDTLQSQFGLSLGDTSSLGSLVGLEDSLSLDTSGFSFDLPVLGSEESLAYQLASNYSLPEFNFMEDDGDLMIGLGAKNKLKGYDGDDILVSAGAQNKLSGGDGNDLLLSISSGQEVSKTSKDKSKVKEAEEGKEAKEAKGVKKVIEKIKETVDDIKLSAQVAKDKVNEKVTEAKDKLEPVTKILEATGITQQFMMWDANRLAGGAGDDLGLLIGANAMTQAGDGNDTFLSVAYGNLVFMDRGDDAFVTVGASNIIFGGSGDDMLTIAGLGNIVMADGLDVGGGLGLASAGDDAMWVAGTMNAVWGGDGDNWFYVAGLSNVVGAGDGNDEYTIVGIENTVLDTGGDRSYCRYRLAA
ncbi:hypothetical protein ACQZV8_10410, partial [Magnetococcales bacterium HHB-1]